MPTAMWLFLSCLSGVYWAIQAAFIARAARALHLVPELPFPQREAWPTLSIIVPARNEGAEVRAALEAKLREGYPELEVVLVDDRSEDDTGAQARAVAAEDDRVTVTRVDTLPEAWLGKVHAMQRGLEASHGEWVLFSDADVHLARGTLMKVMAFAEAERVDHVTVIPSAEPEDRLTTLSLAGFFRLIVAWTRLWAVERPQSSAAMGVGAFNLVRRSALARTPGLAWLKMEIADDGALGIMLKRAGAAQRVLIGRHAVSLRFYPSFGAMARALEKNGAAAPLPLALLGLGVLVLAELGWVTALGSWVGWAVFVLAAGTEFAAARWLGNPRWPALFPGVGMLLLAAVMARSAALAFHRGGVRWRGTYYSAAELRAGRRVG